MNAVLRASWYSSVLDTDTVVCAGDLGGRRTLFGRWLPPCRNLPGRKIVILGNHDFTRFRWREHRLDADRTAMTAVIATEPALLVTHVPMLAVPRGCVNVHGRHHAFKPLTNGPWINVSVEQTGYRPLDLRTEVLPLARTLVEGHTPIGSTTRERIEHALARDARKPTPRAARPVDSSTD